MSLQHLQIQKIIERSYGPLDRGCQGGGQAEGGENQEGDGRREEMKEMVLVMGCWYEIIEIGKRHVRVNTISTALVYSITIPKKLVDGYRLA